MNKIFVGVLKTISSVSKHALLYMAIFFILSLFYKVYSIALYEILIGFLAVIAVCEISIWLVSRERNVDEKIDRDK